MCGMDSGIVWPVSSEAAGWDNKLANAAEAKSCLLPGENSGGEAEKPITQRRRKTQPNTRTARLTRAGDFEPFIVFRRERHA